MTYGAVIFILAILALVWVIAYSTVMIAKDNKEAANERHI